MAVLEDLFQAKFEETEFMKLYMITPRQCMLRDIVEDLKVVMPKHTHECIDEYAFWHKDDPVTAVLHIWTQYTAVTKLINLALMLDGYETFGMSNYDSPDKEKIEEMLKEISPHDYKTILQYTIKFIRMINYCIVKLCTKENTENRVTYRGVPAHLFPNVKVGQSFRVMNFQCTSSETTTPEAFRGSGEEQTMITFQIPKGCFNAGKISKYACDDYKWQNETLIPPYTACKLTKKEGNHLYVEVAKDNKSSKFTYFSY